jgi:serine/threonine protein kinase
VPDHTLLCRIGKGGYGEVWLARNVVGTCHAVKIVRGCDFENAEPFEREFRGIQKVMPISRLHPGLVQILHAGRNDAAGFFYYVMEPADDELSGASINPVAYTPKSLAGELKRHGRLPLAECLRLGLRLSEALEFLHTQGLIHRDIKPGNIIFVRGEPKLADIGLVTDISTPAKEVSYVGTRGYIPPEGPGQPTADLFSLGRVLYEACMGLPRDRFPELPETLLKRPGHDLLLHLNQIILRACDDDLARRYASAAQMRADLKQLQTRLAAGALASEAG